MKFFLFLLLVVPSTSFAGWKAVGNAVGSDSRIKGSKEMQSVLSQISKELGGKTVEVFSAYRSQTRQNQLRAQRGCIKKKCRGTASKSQHTLGIAADVRAAGVGRSGLNGALKRARSKILGNRKGGVGMYCGAEGHIDLGGHREWNVCGSSGKKSKKSKKRK
ncbi:MAG: DUF882 domain-containing protein [Oligoflexia bacterium]|nr:DUF882 domain-containing protein [Oligoflexia bacterium]